MTSCKYYSKGMISDKAYWIVIVALPETVFEHEVNDVLVYMVVIFITGNLFVFLITYCVIGKSTEPLRQLAKTALEIGGGDLGKRFKVMGRER